MKLVDKYPRSVLAEARNYGISFASAEKVDDQIRTVGPLSPCKDFLNDQVYAENSGKPFSIYGYRATHRGLLKADKSFVLMAVLPSFHGSTYTQGNGMAVDTKNLNEHFEDMQEFINAFEKDLPIQVPTKLWKIEDNRIVAELDHWWCRATYRISLWCLLARVALECKYRKGDDYLKTIEDCTTGDSSSLGVAMDKLSKWKKGGFPEQDFTKAPACNWHNCGIVSF